MSLKNDLKGIIPDDALHYLTNHFEVIGDIAIISLRPELNDYKKQIAEGILSIRKNICTVLNKASKLEGDHRTAYYEFLAGTRTLTCHHEYGFLYRLDIGKVFFNSRLGFERRRVTDQVQPDELVLVPFCGVGPFAVPAAARHARVIAIEKNPEACYWLSENISINGVSQNVCIINGNAFDICLRPHKKFDRVIIPTPYGRDAILQVIAPLVKKSGMIHFYTFKKWHQVPVLIEEYEKKGFCVNFFRSCGDVAPGVSRWVFDLIKSDP